MPDFHAKMQNKLRTEAMGADTIVWLAISSTAGQQPSGLFFQGKTLLKLHRSTIPTGQGRRYSTRPPE